MRRKVTKGTKSNRKENMHSIRLVTMECGCGRFGSVAADSTGYVCPVCLLKSALRIETKKEEVTAAEPKKRTRVMTPEGLKSFREKRAATAAKHKAARHQLAAKFESQ